MSIEEDLTPLVEKAVQCNAEDLWGLSRFLWDNPELALREFKAHDRICDFLEGRGFEVRRRHLLDTAFRAEFKAPGGADGPTVAIMAEYDALPEIGHACGHNLIAEAAVGAAVASMEVMKKSSIFRGKIVVIGTPAEEQLGGKEMLLQKGAFQDVDVAMMVHPMHQDTLRLTVNASQQMTVRYEGRACPCRRVSLGRSKRTRRSCGVVRQHGPAATTDEAFLPNTRDHHRVGELSQHHPRSQ
ncbi:hypothetical protein MRX96_044558 [Rhipicephalus microplus]